MAPLQHQLCRRLYAAALRLHPAEFRNRFAREMSLDFDDALAAYGFPRLLADATRSLIRQWTKQILSPETTPTSRSRASLLAGNYAEIQDEPMRPLELARGLIAAAALLALCCLALNVGPGHLNLPLTVYASSRVPANAVPQTATPQAQLLHSDSPLPTFEVATVRLRQPAQPPPPPADIAGVPKPPVRSAPGRGGAQVTDRVHVILPARMLLAFAYNVPVGFEDRSIVGGPAWLDSDVYEVTAKIDDANFAAMQKLPPDRQRDQVQLMEQAFLADRFHLKAHFETRSFPAFALTLAKGRPRLTPAQPGETTRLAMQGDTITATALTLDQLLRSPFLGGRTILNRTGLTGAYDFTLTYSNRTDAAAEDYPSSPALTTAVQQQLGLKLVPTKAAVEVLVIDSMEKPSEN